MNHRRFVVSLIACAATVLPAADCRIAAAEFAVRQEADRVLITESGQPVADYVFRDEQIPRPYFAGLCPPGGLQVTRNHPPVKDKDPVDHDTIHPGVWLAFGDLNGVDFWRNHGRIEHVRFVRKPTVEVDRVSFAVEDRYLAQSGKEVCRGVSEFCVVAGAALKPALPGTVILLATELRAEHEPLVFGPQHEMGLGIRVATPLMVKGGSGSILGSHGGKDEAGNWGRAGAWWDYSGTVDGTRAGILVAAASNNPRAVWAHARDYGFLAMNPTGPPRNPNDSEPSVPFTVAKGEALRLKFAVLVHAQPVADAWSPETAGRTVSAALDAWQPRSLASGTTAPAAKGS